MFSEGRCIFDAALLKLSSSRNEGAVAVNVEEDLPPENILHRFADDAFAAVGSVRSCAHLQEIETFI